MPDDWRGAVLDPDSGLVERIPYELCVLVALRKAIRRREIWVEGANTWRNPDEDLPADFEDNRDVHYEALAKPRDPADFIADLQKRHVAALDRLNKGLKKATTGGVSITRRKGEPWISVPPLGKQTEPENLEALKEEITPPLGCDRPAGPDQERRPRHRLHRRVHLGGLAHGDRREGAAPPAAAVHLRARHEHGDQTCRRRHRGDRRDGGRHRGRAAPDPPAICQPRQPARRDPHGGQQDAGGARCLAVGTGHGVRVGFAQVRLLVGELHDRVAPALRRCRDHGVLARRAQERVHLQPGALHHGLRGGLDDREPAPAPDQRGDRSPVHRYARSFDRGFRVLALAGLQAAAPG